jgi:glyoxylase-like metal-dependent hydrolase (beta-lactamase superfamily II)
MNVRFGELSFRSGRNRLHYRDRRHDARRSGRRCTLVDCGIAYGAEAARWQFPEAARDVAAVLLTHGHNDHVACQE